MTDEHEQPSWSDGAQEEIAHLFARREYLAERMSAAADPNLRSSFAYEINVLDARLADLTSPQTHRNGVASTNGNGHQSNGHESNGHQSNGHEPHVHLLGGEPNGIEPQTHEEEQADETPNWPSDHDEIPEEFYQTLEISSVDLDATAWPGDAARPTTNPDQTDWPEAQVELGLEPIEYHGDEHHRHRSRAVEIQPMDEAPIPHQPTDEIDPTDPAEPTEPTEDQADRFGEVIEFRADGQNGHRNNHRENVVEEPQLFGNQGRYAHADPFDTGGQEPVLETMNGHGHHIPAEHLDEDGYEALAVDEDYEADLYDTEAFQAGLSAPELREIELVSTGDIPIAPAEDDGLPSSPPAPSDDGPEDPRIDAERLVPAANRELFEQQKAQTRPDTSELQVAESRIEASAQRDQTPLPEHRGHQDDDQSGQNDQRTEQDPFDEHQYFLDEDETAKSESRIQLEGFGRDGRRVAPTLLIAGFCFALLAGVLWLGGGPGNDAAQSVDSGAKTQNQASDVAPEMAVANVRDVLERLGVSAVVDYRDGTIHVGGPVPNSTDLDSVSSAVQAVAGEYPVDTSALVVLEPGSTLPAVDGTTNPAPAAPTADGTAAPAGGQLLQSELDRILAVTPLIFDAGHTELTALHQRVLNSAVLVLQSQPGAVVTITGYTDEDGTNDTNRLISLDRAENVKAYLLSQGVPEESLRVEARGEETASGSAALAGLERRVEFEVETAPTGAAKTGPIRIGVVAPSARNDLAFTQSMVDAVNLVAQERGLEVSITDNTFVPEEAAAAVESYAAQGYDLVIAHGSQFGAALIDIAPRYPETAFAWGTASDTFGLPNVYAYDAAAEEGGYVLGTVATMMSGNKISGVVGPIDVGDAGQYVKGFQAGALAQNPASNVLVSFTGSFSDISLASEAAEAHIDGGADVLTGSAQMVVGAISIADQRGVKWFGTQSDQSSLAPNSVVASQVYRWEVALSPILDDVAAGALLGTTYTADLGNGGLVIQFNSAFPIAPEVLQRADEVTAAIVSGAIDPPK